MTRNRSSGGALTCCASSVIQTKGICGFRGPRPFGFWDVFLGGAIEGIEGVTQGRNLYVKPFVVSNYRPDAADNRTDADAGLDVKYGLTADLTLDLTLNTDFSQVEVDEQQVNLTRFNLFFPEKREFFLENAGLFDVGGTTGRFLGCRWRRPEPRSNPVLQPSHRVVRKRAALAHPGRRAPDR